MAFAIDADQEAVKRRVDFCILKAPVFHSELGTSLRDIALDVRLEELTTYFTVFSFNAPRPTIRVVGSFDEALAAGDKEFCLIQNAGHIFYGHGGLAHDLLTVLGDCASVTGRVCERGGYFYLHDQCVLVNRRTWQAAGMPVFGLPHEGMHELAIPEYTPKGRAGEDADVGDLRPSRLAPLPIKARFGYGWNLISASLAAGHVVRQWPLAMHKWKLDCAAYLSDMGTWRKAVLENVIVPRPQAPAGLRAYLDFLSTRFGENETDRPIFVFNSEADTDLPVMGIRPGIDTAFLLAAGFKSNRILDLIGFHDRTEVIFYDYNAATLALKRLTVEEWDGVDFGAFFTRVRPRLEAMYATKLTYLQADVLNSAATINREFQAEMQMAFPAFEQWIAHWRRFKALTHHYVLVDLLREPDTIHAMIRERAKGHSVMWISDAFNAPYAVARFSWQHRRRAYGALADALAANTESSVLIGGAPGLWLAA